MSSIKEVALHAQVSTATVSRVLSGSTHVSENMRRRVLKAIKLLSYRPNRLARSLRVRKSNVIGLIVADIQNSFFSHIGRTIQDEAFKHGYSIFLCNTDENFVKEKNYIELMEDEHVAGIIFSPASDSIELIAMLKTLNIPYVYIDREIKSFPADSVIIDNVLAAYNLTEHIFSTRKKHPVFLTGTYSLTSSLRMQGFTRSLLAHGFSNPAAHIFLVPSYQDDGYTTTNTILNSSIDPDAIIATNGFIAGGCFRKLKESNIAIPEEMAFACFDEMVWTNIVSPPVTVVAQPTQDIGKTAVELLLKRIAKKTDQKPQRIELKFQLIVRASTDPGKTE